MKGKHWIYILILVVVVLLVIWLSAGGESNSPSSDLSINGSVEVTDVNANSDSDLVGFEVEGSESVAGPNKGVIINPSTLPEYSVEVLDQTAGLVVNIDTVSLAQSGWVVVHESVDGEPGVILGAQRFDAGAYAGGRVELLRATQSGMTYHVALRADDGDKSFNHKLDLPIEDGAGNLPVVTEFKTL